MPILPNIHDASFTPGAPVDNPYFPLIPGTISSYRAQAQDEDTGEVETESNDFFVTFETKMAEGLETVVVRDTAYANGQLVEDTLDFHIQDDDGIVWYNGEYVVNYRFDDDGNFTGVDNDGAWVAGVDGAQAGWLMKNILAENPFGSSYYQEFYEGEAVDESIVVGVGGDMKVPAGKFGDLLSTMDYSALEPDVAELKPFAPGVGLVRADEDLDEEGNPELEFQLNGIRQVERDEADEADEANGDVDEGGGRCWRRGDRFFRKQ